MKVNQLMQSSEQSTVAEIAVQPDLSANRRQWAGKMITGVLDQGLFAGGNFLINVFLANWLSENSYGAFIVGYAWFVLVLNLHDALISDPMVIFGSNKFAKQLKAYIDKLYLGHVGLTLLASLVLGAIALVLHVQGLYLPASTFLGLAITTPLLILRWMTRQPFYILAEPVWPILGSVIYLIVIIPLFFGLRQLAILTPASALIAMGVGSLLASVPLTWRFRSQLRTDSMPLATTEIITEHWKYGRWAVGSKAASYISSYAFNLIIPLLLGLRGAAAYSVLNYLVLPILLGMVPLVNLYTPLIVRSYAASGKPGVTKKVLQMWALFLTITSIYGVLLITLGQFAIRFGFGEKYIYLIDLRLLLVLALTPIFSGLMSPLDTALRSMGRVNLTLFINILPAVLNLTLGIFLISQFGLIGAFISSLVATVVTFISLLLIFIRVDSKVQQPIANTGVT